jgi:hypothetical protein
MGMRITTPYFLRANGGGTMTTRSWDPLLASCMD